MGYGLGRYGTLFCESTATGLKLLAGRWMFIGGYIVGWVCERSGIIGAIVVGVGGMDFEAGGIELFKDS